MNQETIDAVIEIFKTTADKLGLYGVGSHSLSKTLRATSNSEDFYKGLEAFRTGADVLHKFPTRSSIERTLKDAEEFKSLLVSYKAAHAVRHSEFLKPGSRRGGAVAARNVQDNYQRHIDVMTPAIEDARAWMEGREPVQRTRSPATQGSQAGETAVVTTDPRADIDAAKKLLRILQDNHQSFQTVCSSVDRVKVVESGAQAKAAVATLNSTRKKFSARNNRGAGVGDPDYVRDAREFAEAGVNLAAKLQKFQSDYAAPERARIRGPIATAMVLPALANLLKALSNSTAQSLEPAPGHEPTQSVTPSSMAGPSSSVPRSGYPDLRRIMNSPSPPPQSPQPAPRHSDGARILNQSSVASPTGQPIVAESVGSRVPSESPWAGTVPSGPPSPVMSESAGSKRRRDGRSFSEEPTPEVAENAPPSIRRKFHHP